MPRVNQTLGFENGKTASQLTDMNRISRQPAAFSKVSVKSQTVIPREVRERLKLKPGDTLRYRITDDGVLLDKATEAGDDLFAAFSEWTSEADEGLWRIVISSLTSALGAKVGVRPRGKKQIPLHASSANRPTRPRSRTRR
jgi:antitoxin PrlF